MADDVVVETAVPDTVLTDGPGLVIEVETGVPGPKGDRGDRGIDAVPLDLPDLTLFFENGLA